MSAQDNMNRPGSVRERIWANNHNTEIDLIPSHSGADGSAELSLTVYLDDGPADLRLDAPNARRLRLALTRFERQLKEQGGNT